MPAFNAFLPPDISLYNIRVATMVFHILQICTQLLKRLIDCTPCRLPLDSTAVHCS